MIETYTIIGMKCNGCVASVKEQLGKHPNVLSVEVTLSPAQAKLEMDKIVSVEDLQKVISQAGNYTIVKS